MRATTVWYKSKTIWSNIAVFTAAVVPVVTSQLGDIVSTDTALLVASILGMVNAVLQIAIRVFMTGTPIERGQV